jgi:hypothetical protein
MPNFFLLWLPSRIFEKKIDLCKNYAEIRAFDGIVFRHEFFPAFSRITWFWVYLDM